jgi:hypothetical protein
MREAGPGDGRRDRGRRDQAAGQRNASRNANVDYEQLAREILAPVLTVADVERVDIHLADGVDHEPREVTLRQPLPDIGRHQKRLLSITRDEALGRHQMVLTPPDDPTSSSASISLRLRRHKTLPPPRPRLPIPSRLQPVAQPTDVRLQLDVGQRFQATALVRELPDLMHVLDRSSIHPAIIGDTGPDLRDSFRHKRQRAVAATSALHHTPMRRRGRAR